MSDRLCFNSHFMHRIDMRTLIRKCIVSAIICIVSFSAKGVETGKPLWLQECEIINPTMKCYAESFVENAMKCRFNDSNEFKIIIFNQGNGSFSMEADYQLLYSSASRYKVAIVGNQEVIVDIPDTSLFGKLFQETRRRIKIDGLYVPAPTEIIGQVDGYCQWNFYYSDGEVFIENIIHDCENCPPLPRTITTQIQCPERCYGIKF